MQLSKPASGSSKRWKNRKSGSFRRRKQKRLDAICEKAYNRNRGFGVDTNVGSAGTGSASVEVEVRRSTRARRPPTFLDVSPPAPKKRRKIGNSDNRSINHSERVNGESSSKVHHSPTVRAENVEEPASWKSRLRARGRANCVAVEKPRSPPGKRKLFENCEEAEEAPHLNDGGLGEKRVVYSRRPGRIKAATLRIGDEESKLNILEEDMIRRDQVESSRANNEEDNLARNEKEANAGISTESNGKSNDDVQTGVPCERVDSENLEMLVDINTKQKQVEAVKVNDKEQHSVEAVGVPPKQVNGGDCKENGYTADVNLLNGPPDDSKAEEASICFVEKLVTYQKKHGRRCGLCGGATDGRPPKMLVHNTPESEKEGTSGSSASEDSNYDKWDGFGDESGWLGRLLGPINDRLGIARTWVHKNCAVWSPEVYFSGLGCLKNIRAALCRGRGLKCTRCGRSGATIGCRVDRCPKTYHLPCARARRCHFNHHRFLIACTKHRRLFQPHGNKYLNHIKRLKQRKMKMEVKKMSNCAWRKDLEAEEKCMENFAEDEEFLRRESKRLHRDILRISPVYIGGSNTGSEKIFPDWDSVAGLQDVIQCMKEVVIVPLLYPEFFDKFGLTPPRGILLHGFPGTGKTHVVRALIGSCARGDKRIAYFACKGADCLGKYVGDAERQLRLLFQVAERSQPSIIFFDEIDGLAPQRTKQQDQTHSSVVSTLLALMDGLKSRGSVVVIGATNRPEAVDPALRRPGRFDREIYFPLPSLKDRAAIVSLHTQKWPNPLSGCLLNWIAQETHGFAGADLQALCTQVALIALKRKFPLQDLLSAAEEKGPNFVRSTLPDFVVEERDWLEALACAPPPCSHRGDGMAANTVVSSPLHIHLVACFLKPLSCLLVTLYLDEHIRLSPPLSRAAANIKDVIFSALSSRRISTSYWLSYVHDMLQEADVAREIERCLLGACILTGEDDFSVSDPLKNDNDVNTCTVSQSSTVGCRGIFSSSMRHMALQQKEETGFRIFICGSPKSGQRHIASFLLQYLFKDAEILKVDMATISHEGRGDILLGITRLLMKYTSLRPSVVFMPRIDLWAIHKEVSQEKSDPSSAPQTPTQEKSNSSSSDSQTSAEQNDTTNEVPDDDERHFRGESERKSDSQPPAHQTSFRPAHNEVAEDGVSVAHMAHNDVAEDDKMGSSRLWDSHMSNSNTTLGQTWISEEDKNSKEPKKLLDSQSPEQQYGFSSTHFEVSEEDKSRCFQEAETTGVVGDDALKASCAWNLFIEQVESSTLSTSLIILATSEVPYAVLPPQIGQFFKCDVFNSSELTSSEGKVPQYLVEIDGKFSHDMVINLAATELVKDVVQLFVQSIHYRTHNVDICPVYDVCDSIDADGSATSHGVGNGSANEPESVSKIRYPNDSAMKDPLPPYSRPLKAKSNLLFAISTFGYQILRYPHFSELCWVTSKLKEGPYADTCGPWKGWPFNTCIVRAGESLDNAAVASATSSIKSSENFRLVRGLIAVGLSAYRGVYTSLGEVSSEVRRVLELLVGQINGKIKAGKD